MREGNDECMQLHWKLWKLTVFAKCIYIYIHMVLDWAVGFRAIQLSVPLAWCSSKSSGIIEWMQASNAMMVPFFVGSTIWSNQFTFLVYQLSPVGPQFPIFLCWSIESNGLFFTKSLFCLNPHCHTTESFTWSPSSHQQSWSWRKCEVAIRVVKCSRNQNIFSLEGLSLLLEYYLGGAFICLLCFHPYLGRWSNLTIFQMGWNHDLNTLLHIAALFLIHPLETAQRSILIMIVMIIIITTNNNIYI